MADEIHVNDVGTQFRLLITDDGEAVDISNSTNVVIFFRKPSGTKIEKEANFYNDGSDGIVFCTSEDGDLDEIGTYKIQAKVEINESAFHSSVASFKVHHNI